MAIVLIQDDKNILHLISFNEILIRKNMKENTGNIVEKQIT